MSHTTSSGQSWDDRYSEKEFAFGTEPNDFLVEVANKITKGDTLVLADGEGRNGVYLASLGHRVVTVDLSPTGVKKSQQLAAERHVEIDAQVGDLAFLRRFRTCRICFRLLSLKGEIPGVRKSSW